MTNEQIKHMTERFLSWKLPENFDPDDGISAKRPNYAPNVKWEPSGTNLFDYSQAEAMVRHMVEGLSDGLYVAAANLRQAQRDYMEVRNGPRDVREPFGRAVAEAADKLDDALASAMSASGQDPQGLEAKPASAVGEAETPNA